MCLEMGEKNPISALFIWSSLKEGSNTEHKKGAYVSFVSGSCRQADAALRLTKAQLTLWTARCTLC